MNNTLLIKISLTSQHINYTLHPPNQLRNFKMCRQVHRNACHYCAYSQYVTSNTVNLDCEVVKETMQYHVNEFCSICI